MLDRIVATAEGNVDRSFWQSFFRHESLSGQDELTGWIQLLFPYTEQDVVVEEPKLLDEPWLDEITGLTSLWSRPRIEKLLRPNPHMVAWEAGLREAEAREEGGWVSGDAVHGPCLPAIPSGIASAPVQVRLGDQSACVLRFVAGLFGVAQDPASFALRPEFGWAIVHEPSQARTGGS